MKRVAVALGAGVLVAGLMITFFYPSITVVWSISKFEVKGTEFIPIWKACEREVHPLWLTGEIVAGLFASGVVLAATGNNKREAPRIR